MTTEPTTALPDLSDISSTTISSEISEPEPSSEEEYDETADLNAARQVVRERLYAHKRPTEKAKKSPPRVDEMNYLLLKEHVRMMNGKSPRLIRKPKLVCWMDSPEIRPKDNRTNVERKKYILDRLEERKDSEEDAFSSRCAN